MSAGYSFPRPGASKTSRSPILSPLNSASSGALSSLRLAGRQVASPRAASEAQVGKQPPSPLRQYTQQLGAVREEEKARLLSERKQLQDQVAQLSKSAVALASTRQAVLQQARAQARAANADAEWLGARFEAAPAALPQASQPPLRGKGEGENSDAGAEVFDTGAARISTSKRTRPSMRPAPRPTLRPSLRAQQMAPQRPFQQKYPFGRYRALRASFLSAHKVAERAQEKGSLRGLADIYARKREEEEEEEDDENGEWYWDEDEEDWVWWDYDEEEEYYYDDYDEY